MSSTNTGPRRRLGLAVALVAPPVVGALVWHLKGTGDRPRDLAWSLYGVTAFLILALLVTELVGRTSRNPVRRRYGYLEVLIGADGYASTSKAVAWIWTLILAAALVLLSCMTWFGELNARSAFGSRWDPYLLLLGGPFASLVLAKGITVAKAGGPSGGSPSTPAGSGAIATTPSQPTGANDAADGPETPGVSDLLKGKSGDTSLTDTQYVLFSLVAIVYFLGAFTNNLVKYAGNTTVATIGLPEIPAALLGLTSLAALTYIGAKVVETNGLRFVSITPNPGKVGIDKSVTMKVVNAAPTLTESMVTVTFADSSAPDATANSIAPNQKSLTRAGAVTAFTVDVTSLKAGTYTVVVTTPDGSTSPLNLTLTG